jgi:hypothetical protein
MNPEVFRQTTRN